MAEIVRLRSPRPKELAVYLGWIGRLVDRANRRWAEVRPDGSPLRLVDRDSLSRGVIRRLARADLPAGYNSRQASAWTAAAYADAPDAVRSAARACLLDLYERAVRTPDPTADESRNRVDDDARRK